MRETPLNSITDLANPAFCIPHVEALLGKGDKYGANAY